MRPLEKRSEKILEFIVAEYIATGEPVGSRTVSKCKDVGLSAATIRNVMSDLTDSGYIVQPHVSAGRIPTDLGYRVYVNGMLHMEPLSPRETFEIECHFKSAGLDFRELLKLSSSILACLSKQAGVVASTVNHIEDQTFKSVEFIKIAPDRILAILVSTKGAVQSKVIMDEDDISQESLERYSRMLNDMLKDLDLRQARARIHKELTGEKAEFDALMSKSLNLCYLVLSLDDDRMLYVDGRTNILDEPEFAQIEKLKSVLVTFEEKSRLLKILDRTIETEGIQILIGSEHGVNEIESCSLVAYPIRAQGRVIGTIGVIGPKRMNYKKVVPVVDATAKVVTRLTSRIVEQVL